MAFSKVVLFFAALIAMVACANAAITQIGVYTLVKGKEVQWANLRNAAAKACVGKGLVAAKYYPAYTPANPASGVYGNGGSVQTYASAAGFTTARACIEANAGYVASKAFVISTYRAVNTKGLTN